MKQRLWDICFYAVFVFAALIVYTVDATTGAFFLIPFALVSFAMALRGR